MSAIELSAGQARELTDRIKLAVEATWELIKEAYQSRAWKSLGYTSWDDYCTREFGTSRIKLPREERQEVVSSMREIGMSMPAIASATGASLGTVHGTLSKLKASGELSDEVKVTGTDGKTYTTKPQLSPVPDPTPPPDPEPSLSFDDEPEDDEPEWEEVAHIPPARLKDVAPRPAAVNIPQEDLDELNTAPGKPPSDIPAPKIHKPLDEDYFDRKDHMVKMLQEARKAEKALKELLYLAQHIDSWSQGSLTDSFRDLLDEIDQTLNSGGMDAALARLIEGENQ